MLEVEVRGGMGKGHQDSGQLPLRAARGPDLAANTHVSAHREEPDLKNVVRKNGHCVDIANVHLLLPSTLPVSAGVGKGHHHTSTPRHIGNGRSGTCLLTAWTKRQTVMGGLERGIQMVW